jgi:hypothetical protein
MQEIASIKKLKTFFYLNPKDLGIQKLDITDIVEIMKPSVDVSDGPQEFADTIYEIFEKHKKENS